MSKTVFAYFVMKMVDKKVIGLDVPLYSYLPYPDIAYDERYKLITARMVLSHTSGMSNWREDLNKTELYIIGTVHESSSILNSEMLFRILDSIRPDILLQENDSMQIAEYAKEIRPTSNE